MARIGPVILSVVGDVYIQGARILAFVWEGATTANDTVTIHARSPAGTPAELLFAGRTDTTSTFQGLNLTPTGLHAPGGFMLTQISAGRVLVYLREE